MIVIYILQIDTCFAAFLKQLGRFHLTYAELTLSMGGC